MGMLDASLQFSSAQAVTASAQSTYFYDQLTGEQLTTTFTAVPTGEIWSKNETYFGEDLGIGKGLGTPRVVVSVGTAFTTLTGLTVSFQGAPVVAAAAANGLRSSLVFVDYIVTGEILVALLTANTRIASFDWPMRKSPQTSTVYNKGLPRFVALYYTVDGSSAGAGTINADVTLGDDDAQSTLLAYGNNFTVAA
jgi:hypothetical protein